MESASIILSISSVLIAVVALLRSERHSKGWIKRQIRKKENAIRAIEHKEVLKYGLNGRPTGMPITKDELKKQKLHSQIETLKEEL